MSSSVVDAHAAFKAVAAASIALGDREPSAETAGKVVALTMAWLNAINGVIDGKDEGWFSERSEHVLAGWAEEILR